MLCNLGFERLAIFSRPQFGPQLDSQNHLDAELVMCSSSASTQLCKLLRLRHAYDNSRNSSGRKSTLPTNATDGRLLFRYRQITQTTQPSALSKTESCHETRDAGCGKCVQDESSVDGNQTSFRIGGRILCRIVSADSKSNQTNPLLLNPTGEDTRRERALFDSTAEPKASEAPIKKH